jgi:hypothetical protein
MFHDRNVNQLIRAGQGGVVIDRIVYGDPLNLQRWIGARGRSEAGALNEAKQSFAPVI